MRLLACVACWSGRKEVRAVANAIGREYFPTFPPNDGHGDTVATLSRSIIVPQGEHYVVHRIEIYEDVLVMGCGDPYVRP